MVQLPLVGQAPVISLLAPRNERQLTSQVERVQRQWGSSTSNIVNGGRSLWRLYHDMQVGDLVILNTNRRELVMRVTGDYYYFESEPYQHAYGHQRKAEPLPIDPEWLWKRSGEVALG